MIPEMLIELIGEATVRRLSPSRTAQVLVRVFFGLLGTGLGLFGAYHFLARVDPPSNRPLLASVISLFLSVAAFSFVNVACKRPWRWPLLGVAVSLAALFVTRIAFGP